MNSSGFYKMRCSACGARNRIPSDKVDANPVCGKCKSVLKTEALFLPQPVVVSDINFDEMVLKSPLPVLLFFWAPWCPTCMSTAPVIDEFAADAMGKVRVGKLNVDNSPRTASKFNVLSVPNMLIFDKGRLRENMLGSMPKHDIMMKMSRYI
ncbi:MAG: thioredoxin family protein [Desulfobacterales bacterium]